MTTPGARKRVAIVIANPAISTTTGWPVGFWWSDLITQGFIHTPDLAARVRDTKRVADIDVARFDAIVVAGGQAPMFNFASATDLHAKFVEFHEAGRIVAALCHGTAILRYARLQRAAPTSCMRGSGGALPCATATSSRASRTSRAPKPRAW